MLEANLTRDISHQWNLWVNDRSWLKITLGDGWENLLSLLGHPCCYRGIWKYAGKIEDMVLHGRSGAVGYWLLNNPLTCWASGSAGATIPVEESWVEDNFPQEYIRIKADIEDIDEPASD